MRERPIGVPHDAEWDSGDDEWLVANVDRKGRRHGLVTFWRADGTLVNHCHYKHGTPHGLAVRYHESGEVSRRCVFVGGVLSGTDASYRSAAPTTELAFPSSQVADSVWRYEVDWVGGGVTTARCYDRTGRQVTDTGEPMPDLPDGVPPTAVFLARSATWLHGHTDTDGKQHGLWRSWSRDGIPTGEIEMEHGAELGRRAFAAPEEGLATAALREGHIDDATALARQWWSRRDDVILAGALLGRCLQALPSSPETTAECRAVYTTVADEPAVMWVFTDEGRRSYEAQASALDWLSRDALADGRADDAVVLADRAIATEFHYGPCAARAAKGAALLRLGRREEAYDLARATLRLDPGAAGFDEIRTDPAFAEWIASISTDTMTLEGAWEVLGRRGERLASIAGTAVPLRDDSDDSEDSESADSGVDETEDSSDVDGQLDVAWPIRDVLGSRLSPELERWLDDFAALPSFPWRQFEPAVTSTVAEAVAAEDGTWLARLQHLFLPTSAVLIEDEVIRHATWLPGPEGTSSIYYTDQDEPGCWHQFPSLAAMLVDTLLEEHGDRVTVPAAPREQWSRAAELMHDEEPPPGPAHLSVEALYPRTGWIAYHLTTVELEEGLPEAPGMDVWEAERSEVPAWPHLQAYWLFHHLVFDNRVHLPYLLECAERRLPVVAELAGHAEAVLAGREVDAPWWDEARVHGLRTTACDQGHGRLMAPDALARLDSALSTVDDGTSGP